MKTDKGNILIAMVICGAIFILGMLQYYIPSSSPLAGNYMMAVSTLIVFLIFFALYIEANILLVRNNKKRSRYVLFFLPMVGSYLLAIISIMGLNLLDMHTSHSMFKEVGIISIQMFSSIGYWSILVVLETIILIMLINKTLNQGLNSNNQL